VGKLLEAIRDEGGDSKIPFEILNEDGGSASDGEKVTVTKSDWNQYRFVIRATSDYCTTPGMQHLAQGLAAVTFTFGKMLGVDDSTMVRLLQTARAACAPMQDSIQEEASSQLEKRVASPFAYGISGGFVHWDATEGPTQVATMKQWEELRILSVMPGSCVCTTTEASRQVPSMPLDTRGALARIKAAIASKNLTSFCVEVLAESERQLPSDLNDLAAAIVSAVNSFNETMGEPILAYALNDDNHPILFTTSKELPVVLKMLATRFPPTESSFSSYCNDLSELGLAKSYQGFESLLQEVDYQPSLKPGSVNEIVVSQLGEGARITKLGGKLKEVR